MFQTVSCDSKNFSQGGDSSNNLDIRNNVASALDALTERYVVPEGPAENLFAEQKIRTKSKVDEKTEFISRFLTPNGKKDVQRNKTEDQRTHIKVVDRSRDLTRAFSKRVAEPVNQQIRPESTIMRAESPVKEESDKLVCLIKTNEPHLKRAVERRSQYWCANTGKFTGASGIFDVKFEFQDQPTDYSQIKPVQLFNHFQFNTEITTKSGLCKTLYNNTYHDMKTDEWFPRCYDLSQTGQKEELINDYMKTAVQIIIRKHNQLFKQFSKEIYLQLQEMKRKKEEGIDAYNYRTNKSDIMCKMVMQFPLPYLMVNTRMLERTFKFIKLLLKNEAGLNDLVKDELKPHDKQGIFFWNGQGSITKMFSDKTWKELLAYSKMDLPVQDWKNLPNHLGIPDKDRNNLEKFINLLHQNCGVIQKREDRDLCYQAATSGWERPSLYIMYKVQKYHQMLKKNFPQYSMDGSKNVWIVKPCYNARGFGIYCIDDCMYEFQNTMSNGSNSTQSKIVQKYIERPLLLQQVNEARKFDIRQWVMVSSYEPLRIFMFDEFYVRLCGSKYDIDDIKDSYKHLTNFSIQKHNSKVNDKALDLVMSQQEFFKKALKNDETKIKNVKEGFKKIIIKTIKSGQEAGIEHKANCFEIYGFDFMLDRNLNPWLLEVNLSPACAERTPWLVNMLDRMADGLFDMIESKFTKVSDDFRGSLRKYLIKKRKFEPKDNWTCIFKEQLPATDGFIADLQNQYQVLACNKINTRIEKKVGNLYTQDLAARYIQRKFRGYLGRKTLSNMRFELVVIYIQSKVRMFLAKNERRRRMQEKYSVVVQKFMRLYLAKKNYYRLLAEAYDAMKLRKVCLIQQQARIFIQKVRIEKQLRQSSALKIQKRFRGIVGRKKFNQYKSFVTQVKTIQMFYRRRLQNKKKSSTIIKKFIKGYKIYNKYQRLLKVNKAYQQLTKVESKKLFLHKIAKWRQYSIQMRAATRIQIAVKVFLKKVKKNISRNRMMQFYWKKISRLMKYYKCWEACHLIKMKMKTSVNLIQSQYKIWKFKTIIRQRVYNTQSRRIQKYLKKYLANKRQQFYDQNLKKIITIQSTFRMVLAKQKAMVLLKKKIGKYQARKKFQQKYLQVFNKKVSRRRKRIETLEKQSLLQERIYVAETADLPILATSAKNDGRIKPGPGGLQNLSYFKKEQYIKKDPTPLRNEKAQQAFKFIQQHKHFYNSNSQSKDSFVVLPKQKKKDYTPLKRKQTAKTREQSKITEMEKKYFQGPAPQHKQTSKFFANLFVRNADGQREVNKQRNKQISSDPNDQYLQTQLEHHDKIMDQIRKVQERSFSNSNNQPASTTAAKRKKKNDEMNTVLDRKLFDSINSEQRDKQMIKAYGEREEDLTMKVFNFKKNTVKDTFQKNDFKTIDYSGFVPVRKNSGHETGGIPRIKYRKDPPVEQVQLHSKYSKTFQSRKSSEPSSINKKRDYKIDKEGANKSRHSSLNSQGSGRSKKEMRIRQKDDCPYLQDFWPEKDSIQASYLKAQQHLGIHKRPKVIKQDIHDMKKFEDNKFRFSVDKDYRTEPVPIRDQRTATKDSQVRQKLNEVISSTGQMKKQHMWIPGTLNDMKKQKQDQQARILKQAKEVSDIIATHKEKIPTPRFNAAVAQGALQSQQSKQRKSNKRSRPNQNTQQDMPYLIKNNDFALHSYQKASTDSIKKVKNQQPELPKIASTAKKLPENSVYQRAIDEHERRMRSSISKAKDDRESKLYDNVRKSQLKLEPMDTSKLAPMKPMAVSKMMNVLDKPRTSPHPLDLQSSVFELSCNQTLVKYKDLDVEDSFDDLRNISRYSDNQPPAFLFSSDSPLKSSGRYALNQSQNNSQLMSDSPSKQGILAIGKTKEEHSMYMNQLSKKTARKIVESYKNKADIIELDSRQIGSNKFESYQSNHRFMKQQQEDNTNSPPRQRSKYFGYRDIIEADNTPPVIIPKCLQKKLIPIENQPGTSHRNTRHTTTTQGNGQSRAASQGSHFSSHFNKSKRGQNLAGPTEKQQEMIRNYIGIKVKATNLDTESQESLAKGWLPTTPGIYGNKRRDRQDQNQAAIVQSKNSAFYNSLHEPKLHI